MDRQRLAPLKPQVHIDPRLAACFDRFHERAPDTRARLGLHVHPGRLISILPIRVSVTRARTQKRSLRGAGVCAAGDWTARDQVPAAVRKLHDELS